jgi:protein-S-isoprenylcysteine O-methyltransferase Ste14
LGFSSFIPPPCPKIGKITHMASHSNDLIRKSVLGLLNLFIILVLVLFLPVGTIHYWQAWIYLFAFMTPSTLITIYFLKYDPSLIERRLKAGPSAEGQKSQKIIQAFASLFFVILFIFPALDHRFHWSDVPLPLVIASDLFVALGFLLVFFVFKENSFTSATIETSSGQTVVSTGPYRIIRHPMYAGALVMLLFTPLALGSYWGLFFFLPIFLLILLRLLEEEKFLSSNLPGYTEYRQKTRFRLIPGVW